MALSSEPKSRKPVRGHRDLIVWQRACELVVECDRLCAQLYDSRRYVLGDQLFRAALSVPANIAEGQGRLSKSDNVRHLAIARGSLRELDTMLVVAEKISALQRPELDTALRLADEVGRMLTGLIRKLGREPCYRSPE